MLFLASAESIQLVPDGTLVIHIAIIITMVFILNRVLFRPINRILDERENRTRGRSKEAREIIQRVGESMSRYEDSLRQARAEGLAERSPQEEIHKTDEQQKVNQPCQGGQKVFPTDS